MTVGVSLELGAAVDVSTTEVVMRAGVDFGAVSGAAGMVGVIVGEPHAARVNAAIMPSAEKIGRMNSVSISSIPPHRT